MNSSDVYGLEDKIEIKAGVHGANNVWITPRSKMWNIECGASFCLGELITNKSGTEFYVFDGNNLVPIQYVINEAGSWFMPFLGSNWDTLMSRKNVAGLGVTRRASGLAGALIGQRQLYDNLFGFEGSPEYFYAGISDIVTATNKIEELTWEAITWNISSAPQLASAGAAFRASCMKNDYNAGLGILLWIKNGAKVSDFGGEFTEPLNAIMYSTKDMAPFRGSRMSAIKKAFQQELELVKLTGRGTRPWSEGEIKAMQQLITNGPVSDKKAYNLLKSMGYTGHHINGVKGNRKWIGDPRNIFFLRQGKGEEHVLIGHGGHFANSSPVGLLIDRAAMIKSIDMGDGLVILGSK